MNVVKCQATRRNISLLFCDRRICRCKITQANHSWICIFIRTLCSCDIDQSTSLVFCRVERQSEALHSLQFGSWAKCSSGGEASLSAISVLTLFFPVVTLPGFCTVHFLRLMDRLLNFAFSRPFFFSFFLLTFFAYKVSPQCLFICKIFV